MSRHHLALPQLLGSILEAGDVLSRNWEPELLSACL